jgi:hypothetical protein
MQADICLLCLEELSPPLQKPSSCNCNVSLHKKCMEDIQQNGLLCPICRIKGFQTTPQNVLTQLSPFALFIERPNALTFFIFFAWCTLALCIAACITVCIAFTIFACVSILCLASFIFIEAPYRLFFSHLERTE